VNARDGRRCELHQQSRERANAPHADEIGMGIATL
jgi:hypothetical protein